MMQIWDWIWPLLMVLIYGYFAIWFHRRLTFPGTRLQRRLRHQALGDFLGQALGWPLTLILILIGLMILFRFWPVGQSVRLFVLNAERMIVIGAVILYLHRFLDIYFKRSRPGTWMRITILQKIAYFTIYTLGILMALDILGLPIAPLLTSLGIGSLAVALAVREILANFFAGIQLAIERPIEVGETVLLENGISGEVLQIGWMKTHLLGPDGARILIPNAKLQGFIIQNYMKGAGVPVALSINIDRQADLDRAEALARELAGQWLTAETGSATRDAAIRIQFTQINPASITLNIVFHVKTMEDQARLKSGYLKHLNKAFQQANIALIA